MSSHKYRSSKSSKSDKYASKYSEYDDPKAPYSDHYSHPPSAMMPSKSSKKLAPMPPDYDMGHGQKKSFKYKDDYSDSYKESSKKSKSKDDYYSYKEEPYASKGSYYEDSFKGPPPASSSSSKKYYNDDFYYKESSKVSQSYDRPEKSYSSGKGDPYYEVPYKVSKSSTSYNPPPPAPPKKYKDQYDRKFSRSPHGKMKRRSYSLSPPRRGQHPPPGRGDYPPDHHSMSKLPAGPSSCYMYDGPPPPLMDHRNKEPDYDRFYDDYHNQRGPAPYAPHHPPPPIKEKKYALHHPPPPIKEKKYAPHEDFKKQSGKKSEQPAQLSRYVIGDSVVYGSPGHYPQGLLSASPSPPRSSKYQSKQFTPSPPRQRHDGGRYHTPSLSPHYPDYDNRRPPPGNKSTRRPQSPSPRRDLTGGKRPPPPRNSNSSQPSKRPRNDNPYPGDVGLRSSGPAMNNQPWIGKKTAPPSKRSPPRRSRDSSVGRGDVKMALAEKSSRNLKSPRRSQSHEEKRKSFDKKKPLNNMPNSSPPGGQGLLGAKPALLSTPLLTLPTVPPLMGVGLGPGMPLFSPPLGGRGLLDGRLGLGDRGRGRGNMHGRPIDLRGLIESRKERHQSQGGNFPPRGPRGDHSPRQRRRSDRPMDEPGRRPWHPDDRPNRGPGPNERPPPPRPGVRERLVARDAPGRPAGLRKPGVGRAVPRLNNRRAVPGRTGDAAVRPRNIKPGAVIRGNRPSTLGGKMNPRGLPVNASNRPKLSSLNQNRTTILKKYQRLTGRGKLGGADNSRRTGNAPGLVARRKLGGNIGRGGANIGRGGGNIARRGATGVQRRAAPPSMRKGPNARDRPNPRDVSNIRRDDGKSSRSESKSQRRDTSRDDSRSRREKDNDRKDDRGRRDEDYSRDASHGRRDDNHDNSRRDNDRTRRDDRGSSKDDMRSRKYDDHEDERSYSRRDKTQGSLERSSRRSRRSQDLDRNSTNNLHQRKIGTEETHRGSGRARHSLDRSPKVTSATKNKKRAAVSRSPSASSSDASYNKKRDSSASRSPRHNKFSRSVPSYSHDDSLSPRDKRSKLSPLPKNSKYDDKKSRNSHHSRSQSSSRSVSYSSGQKSLSPSLSP